MILREKLCRIRNQNLGKASTLAEVCFYCVKGMIEMRIAQFLVKKYMQ